MRHVAAVRQNNPRMNGNDVMKVASHSYRGATSSTGKQKHSGPDTLVGHNWFIAADNGGWLPAKEQQVVAIEAFIQQDETNKIPVGLSYYNFLFIGRDQSDRRYAIQDRTKPHKFREFIHLVKGEIKELKGADVKRSIRQRVKLQK